VLIGLTSYVPTYLEGALGTSPIVAGLALAALTLGWPLSASQSGRLYLRFGFRPTILIGMVFVVGGATLLALTAHTPSVLVAAACCFVVGLGLGLVATPSLISAQASVDWNERGVATGTNAFSRSVGSAVGVAIFGAVANGIFAQYAGGADDPAAVIAASTGVFVAVLVAAGITVVAALAMPRSYAPGSNRVPKPTAT